MSYAPGIKLSLPVPDSLFKALDYDGNARFVALYWTPAGDEAEINDGRFRGTTSWLAYSAYMDHPAVRSGLAQAGFTPWSFGSSDSTPGHWLMFDREENAAYAVPVPEAAAFLERQHASQDISPVSISWEQIEALAHTLEMLQEAEVGTVTMEEIEASIREEEERAARLERDLDRWYADRVRMN